MKRFGALLVAFCLLFTGAVAEGTGETRTAELTSDSLTVYRVKETGQNDTQQYTLDYPAFESQDDSLAAYLTQTITEPLLALRRTTPMNEADAYEGGNHDVIRMSFFASLDFDGVLSVEASVGGRSADQQRSEMLFFYRIIDLNARRELTVYDLFTEPREAVDAAIRAAVYAIQSAQSLAIVTDASQVPAPNSIFLSADVFRCLYAAGTVSAKATVVDVPWEQLSLTKAPVLSGVPSEPVAVADDAYPDEEDVQVTSLAAGDSPLSSEAIAARVTANDWLMEGQILRFASDGSISATTGDVPALIAYRIQDGRIYLDSAERPDQAADVFETQTGLLLQFDPEISDYETITLLAVQGDAQPAVVTPPPVGAAETVTVTTPTPLPLTGDDAVLADFLTDGLWKPLGSDGNVYYQFTPDGKLLTIEVSTYTLEQGELISDALSGAVSAGGTAFTLTDEQGGQTGYVLNRSATAIPGEAFVTATPTPQPTPTPEPTPEVTPEPTPEPTATPEPTPTLSPYELAADMAPTLAALSDASFEKRQTLKVYSAPDEASFRDSRAQVTTDDKVQIYGVTGDWVLVAYEIGNGSKGRIGYIENSTLANAETVAQLALVNIPLKLTKKANATDDPLRGKGKLFDIAKDTEVTLLAFLGKDWAYVETTYKSKPCRVFIPRSALMQD